jgi:hypothetical protein
MQQWVWGGFNCLCSHETGMPRFVCGFMAGIVIWFPNARKKNGDTLGYL